jgi:hypothetical protein
MWDVREQDSTKLGQQDSLGLGMMLTWNNEVGSGMMAILVNGWEELDSLLNCQQI